MSTLFRSMGTHSQTGHSALRLILLALLLALVRPWLYHSLQSGFQFKEGDQIVSTLGLYKVVLSSQDCSLNFHKFNEASQNYQPLQNNYQGNYQGACQWLTIIGSGIQTDTGQSFLKLSSNFTSQISLLIDDAGSLRLIGLQSSSISLPSSSFE